MAALGSQTIASSYEQLLHVDRDGGGNGTTHVALKDGDNGTTFPITLATDAVMITSTNRLEFGDDGTYIHQSADGVLDLVSDTEIEINATTIDINGAVDISGDTNLGGGLVITNTNAGAGSNHTVSLIRNSASPADDDYLGMIEFKGEDSASASESYADITAQIIDEANSSEDCSLRFRTMKAGTLTETMRLTSGNVGIGDDAPDCKLKIQELTHGSNIEFKMRAENADSGTGRTWTFTGDPDARTLSIGEGAQLIMDTANGHLGIGVTPEATNSLASALQIGGNAYLISTKNQAASGEMDFGHNFYWAADGNQKYISTDEATQYRQGGGVHVFKRTDSGSADATITWTEGMRIDSTGVKAGAAFLSANGSTSAPSFAFTNETNLGFYRPNPGQIGVTIGGNYKMLIGGNETQIINTLQLTNQPAFLAHPASTQSDIAKDTAVTVVLGTEVFDQNSNFASNAFTAPKTGKYQLQAQIRLNSIDTGATYYEVRIVTSNRTYAQIYQMDKLSADAYWTLKCVVLADMDASDTASVAIYQSGGDVQTDVMAESYFSGFLAC